VSHEWKQRSGDCRNTRQSREQDNGCASRSERVSVTVVHFLCPFSLARDHPSPEMLFSASRVRRSHLMGSLYATQAIAKMIAVPDNLIETPDRDSGWGFQWTFSTKS
jgi:hypothetical protein